MARAMWKGQLQLGKQQLGVKLYSAVEDRTVHFHLLHCERSTPRSSSTSFARTPARMSPRTTCARPSR